MVGEKLQKCFLKLEKFKVAKKKKLNNFMKKTFIFTISISHEVSAKNTIQEKISQKSY